MLKLEDVLKESYKLNKIKGWKQKEYTSQKKEEKKVKYKLYMRYSKMTNTKFFLLLVTIYWNKIYTDNITA